MFWAEELLNITIRKILLWNENANKYNKPLS